MPKNLFPISILAAVLGACSDPNALPPATETNLVDTITMYSLNGTPVNLPSAFLISESRAVRTDQVTTFDFAFTFDGTGRAVFLPAVAAGVPGGTAAPGLLPDGRSFDQITIAPFDGYITQDTVPTLAGDTYVLRSRILCTIGVPLYGKLSVLEINPAPDTLSITFEVLVNGNCGYRGLEPGVPDV